MVGKKVKKLDFESVQNQWDERAKKDTIDIDKKDPFWDRYEKKQVDKLLRFVGSGKILDLGAGTGRLTNYIAQKGFDVAAMDYSSEAIKVLKNKYPDIPAQVGDITKLQLTDNYKGILLCRVLQSLPEKKQKKAALNALKKNLTIDGKILLIEGNANRLTPHPQYNFYLSLDEWKKVFDETGYKLEQISSIPTATLLGLKDGKNKYALREKFPILYKTAYAIDGIIGKINPGWVSHEFSMILGKK